MKFIVSSTALSDRLTALARVITNSKNSLPILGDFGFNVTSDALRLIAKDEETGHMAKIEETVREVENNEQESEEKNKQVFIESITLQSDSRYAERGYIQSNFAQEEGNNAQRGRRRSHRAVLRVAWLARYYGGIRQNEAHVLRHSRLARHRRRSNGLLCREEATGPAGRCRTATTVRPCFVDRIDQRRKWWSGESVDRHQSASTVLFVNTTDGRA